MPITNVQMFNNVYNLAKNATSLEDLKQKLAKEPPETYIDILNPDYPHFSAAGVLASEGQYDEVEWLRQLGASVNLIVEGYAAVNNHERVILYEIHHHAYPAAVVLGYAYAKNDDKVTEYASKGVHIDQIGYAYACANNTAKAEEYHAKGACPGSLCVGFVYSKNSEALKKYNTNGATLNSILYAHAFANHQEDLNSYAPILNEIGNGMRKKALVRGAIRAGLNLSDSDYSYLLPTELAFYYAAAGNHYKVSILFAEYGEEVRENIILAYVLFNYRNYAEKYTDPKNDECYRAAVTEYDAQLGKHNLVEEAQKSQKTLEAMLRGYIYCGYHKDVETHITPETIDDVARHYAHYESNNDSSRVDYYLGKGANPKSIIRSYALNGNDKRVNEFLKKFENDNVLGELLREALDGYITSEHHHLVEKLRIDHEINVDLIACLYAGEAEHDKTQDYIKRLKASVISVLEGYIATKQWAMVDLLLDKHFINSAVLAELYSRYGHLDKAEYYDEKYLKNGENNNHRGIMDFPKISRGFFLERLEKLEERVTTPTSSWIRAWRYAALGNNEQVEHYFHQGIEIEMILDGYRNNVDAQSIPPFYKALLLLSASTLNRSFYTSIKNSMIRLKEGSESYSLYWINSGKKLEAIINAINNLPQAACYPDLLNDTHSELYQALNMQRLSPLTFFGGFAVNESQTLRVVQASMEDAAVEPQRVLS